MIGHSRQWRCNLPDADLNFILISLDTTRADHLSCYGYSRLTSPHLDRFAAEGAIFERCFSTHIPTHPAHTCMMTGYDPFQTGIIAQGAQIELDPAVPMLASSLKSRGYFTAAADNLGRWFTRGFDLYDGYQWDIVAGEPWRKAEAVNRTALRIVKTCAAQEKPFFAFLHYWDCHTPYLPPAPFSRMFYFGCEKDPANPSMDSVWEFEPFAHYFAEWMPGVTDIEFPKAQYDAEIAYLDANLAHLFHSMEALGLMENTCVIITADHGEEMDEHSCWFDHHGLYDTNIRIPLIVRVPGLTHPGQRIPGMVRLLDVAPTISDLAAGVAAAEIPTQGQSLTPLLTESRPGSEGTCAEIFLTESTWMRKRGYRDAQYKLICALEPDIHGKAPVELFDLGLDPGEQHNLAQDRPEIVQSLTGRIDRWRRDREHESGRPDPLDSQKISLRRVGNPDTVILKRKK